MQVSWDVFAAFLSGDHRPQAVREAWTRHEKPYDEAAERTPDPLGRTIRAAWRDGRPPAAGAAPGMERLAAWLSRHQVRDGSTLAGHARLGDLVVTLPAVFEATIDGIPSAVVLHTEAAPPEDRSVDLLLCALLRRGKDRRPAVLDVYRERLLTGPRSGQADETLTRGSREFAAMWRRFAALANRMNIHSYLPAGTDIVAWDIGQLDWHGVRDVADVGCGTGRHLARLKGQDLRIIGVDPSIGALRRAAAETNGRGVTFITGDVAHLPIADDSADVVLAMHMLYNVDDIDQGLVEIRRVLRPGGRLLATTSSPYHLAEFGKLYEQSVRALCTDLPAGWHSGEPRLRRFDLDTGLPVLRRHFCEVDRRDLTLPLIYPEGEPVIHYLDTTRRWREPNLPPGLAWGSVIAEARRRIAEIIAAEGAFRASLREGGFACRT